MVAHDEYRAALKEYQIAQHHFDQADPEHVDVAIHRLRAAELRLEAILIQLKGEAQSQAEKNL